MKAILLLHQWRRQRQLSGRVFMTMYADSVRAWTSSIAKCNHVVGPLSNWEILHRARTAAAAANLCLWFSFIVLILCLSLPTSAARQSRVVKLMQMERILCQRQATMMVFINCTIVRRTRILRTKKKKKKWMPRNALAHQGWTTHSICLWTAEKRQKTKTAKKQRIRSCSESCGFREMPDEPDWLTERV